MNEDANDSISILRDLVSEAAEGDRELRRKLDTIWMVLLLSIVVGSLVLGGLVVHAIGDFYRFEQTQEELVRLEKKIEAFHAEAHRK